MAEVLSIRSSRQWRCDRRDVTDFIGHGIGSAMHHPRPSAACHWEHTVAVTSVGLWVLTAEDGGEAELATRGDPVRRPPGLRL